ncbi:MAG TPA: sugar isomerase [Acidothermaceae bacterium]
MPHVSSEIRRQPESWARATALAPTVSAALPRPGERVAVIGCGTSWFMAEAYATLRESTGHGETDFFAAADLPLHRNYDRMVAITRSGTTTEVLSALAAVSFPTTTITADGSSPVVAAADQSIVLDFADEQSVVQTVFATTALMLLRASLGEQLGGVISQAEQVLSAPHDAALDGAQQFTFLGQGWAHGVAREAALKMRESAQAWTEAYPQMEYRHGPISIAEPGRVVWVFGQPVRGLLDDIKATGAALICDELDPVADLVRVQLLAVLLAEAGALDPDRPRNLSRSVVLETQ